jgi:hypothetical protein
MINRHGLSARVAPSVAPLLVSLAMVAGCGEPIGSESDVGEGSLALCTGDAGCEVKVTAESVLESAPESTAVETAWLVRCTADTECAIGACVCGLCTESCTSDESGDACGGVPEGASCFDGGTVARAALCHATTVPGICLPPCDAGDDCGEGFICALGACLPRPPRH